MAVDDAQPITVDHVHVATSALAWEMTKYALSRLLAVEGSDEMRAEFAKNYTAIAEAVTANAQPRRQGRTI